MCYITNSKYITYLFGIKKMLSEWIPLQGRSLQPSFWKDEVSEGGICCFLMQIGFNGTPLWERIHVQTKPLLY